MEDVSRVCCRWAGTFICDWAHPLGPGYFSASLWKREGPWRPSVSDLDRPSLRFSLSVRRACPPAVAPRVETPISPTSPILRSRRRLLRSRCRGDGCFDTVCRRTASALAGTGLSRCLLQWRGVVPSTRIARGATPRLCSPPSMDDSRCRLRRRSCYPTDRFRDPCCHMRDTSRSRVLDSFCRSLRAWLGDQPGVGGVLAALEAVKIDKGTSELLKAGRCGLRPGLSV